MSATLTEAEREDYAKMLIKHYPTRVLRHLMSLPIAELQAVGNASEEEANAAHHEYFSKQVAQYGAG